MSTARALVAVWIVCVSSTSAQERAWTAEGALRAYERVREREDFRRGWIVDVLGQFEGEAIEAVLLAELGRAQLPSLKRRVVVALGAHRRSRALAPLCAALDGAGADYRLRDAAALAIGAQGEAGLDALLERVRALPRERLGRDALGRRESWLRGVAHHGGERAIATLVGLAEDGDAVARRQALECLEAVAGNAAVTAARRAASAERDSELAAEAVRQLALHGDPESKALALGLHRKTAREGTGSARADVLEALCCVLDGDTYEAFLDQAAAVDPEVDHVLRRLGDRLRDQAGLGAWLIAHGLRGGDAARKSVAIRLLGAIGGDDVTAALVPLLRDRELTVAAAAARSLGARGDRAAEGALRAVVEGGDEARAAEAMLGLGLLLGGDAEWRSDLLAMARQQQGPRRALALDLLAAVGAEEALAIAYRDFDAAAWQVRAAAYDFCRRVRHRDSVPRLIKRLDAERARLRADLLDALESITGLRFSDRDHWRRWWEENEATFRVAPLREPARPVPGGTAVTYYDLSITSDRCTFVLDVSGSMDLPFGPTGASSRLAEAKRQLERVLAAVKPPFSFNIVLFGTTVKAIYRELRAADPKTVAKALEAVRALEARGRTNVHDALELAFADEAVDTIYLLSDGYPSDGRIRDPQALADAVQRWNRTRRIRIHAVAVGADSPLCRRLAEDSGGEYRHLR